MPKLKAGVSVPADFFNVNGLDYVKGNYEVAYGNIQQIDVDTVKDDVLEIGIGQKFTGDTLQASVNFSQWTDSTDTPYASVDLLLTDMNTLGVFSG